MEIILVTENEEKIRIAKVALQGHEVELVVQKRETPEIQSEDSKEIAEYSAKYAANFLKKPVLKTDACWNIKALNGFPGPFSKYVNKWLSPNDYIKLLQGKQDRTVEIIEYLSYCEPAKEPISFYGVAKGKIAHSPVGERGTVLDKIFVPEGFSTTASDISESQMAEFWANNFDHWYELLDYLKNPRALCFLAIKKELTETQIMDLETINWIKRKTRPDKAKAISDHKWIPVNWSEIAPFIPSKDDYLVKSTYRSIHGIMHTLRVLVYAAILCKENNLDKGSTVSVLEAAKFHDTCRLNDKKDAGHGKRASKKATNNLTKKIIAEHDLYENSELIELRVLKMADALDRFRLPSENWFPKLEFLDASSEKLIEAAKYLVWKSEEMLISGKSSPKLIIKKISEDLGLVKDD